MSGLTRSDIDDILRLIDASDFDELKLEMGDTKIELRRRGAAAPQAQPAPAPAPQATQPTLEKPPAPVQAPVVASGGGSEVPAPLLGTFYHAPKPGADPFVKPGDRVNPETVIGIIEVMKLMNSVEAGIAGTVIDFVAPNGELVEHGQTLIRIQPD
ncbi:acetyl-CoA carboxylase biotin carboxyl carrier protein [Maritimibacter sp. DP1N21-5]|uniref:acetyl-CoA carboxylase biotin carboxyl carrier protein n=1 Tax=Maritimibacter sp. DP1N21-5 TaxID=2836867 RepID=UPI001C45B5BF|nr:acetyl-CoA carboxylase biotin carboxyl carrier protein [Maritimibacter sp. DP1N21-5]MBV7410662.1 acetyl-CoA carboxylase biotin carboxyl carrier protein [Maritimibacter sp. DP1N21-5]